MKKGMIQLGLIAALGVSGVMAAGEVMGGELRVVSTIQTGPEWEPLGRSEPLVESRKCIFG
ncbi:MAG: hypothetical protein R3B44_14900 [Candidatus Brocadiaceae bacterium]